MSHMDAWQRERRSSPAACTKLLRLGERARAAGWMLPGGSGRPQPCGATAADAAAAAAANAVWLEDAAVRLLCVLALDRFGDFVSDQARRAGLRSLTMEPGRIQLLPCAYHTVWLFCDLDEHHVKLCGAERDAACVPGTRLG
jgi:hypothetical protein